MRGALNARTRSTFTPFDVGLLLALGSMWGFSFLFIKVAVAEVSPLWVVGSRTLVGAAVLFAILRLRGRVLPRGPVWIHLLVLAVLSNVLPWGTIAWAEQFIPSGIAAVLNALTPMATLAIAATIGLERLGGVKIAGLVAALAGTGLIVSGEVAIPGRVGPVLAVVGATGLYAIGAVYAKRYVSGRQPALAIATGQVLLAGVISIPAAWIVGPTPAWTDLSLAAAGSLVALGGLGTGVAFYLFYALIERVGATNATMVTYLIPVIGLLAGWAVLGETFGWHVLAGTAVIVTGIWLAQREPTRIHEDALTEMEQIRG